MTTEVKKQSIVLHTADGTPLILESIEQLKELLAPKKNKSKFTHNGPVAIKDLQTGAQYDSQAQCAKAVDPVRYAQNSMLIYPLADEFPNRFQKADGTFVVGWKTAEANRKAAKAAKIATKTPAQ